MIMKKIENRELLFQKYLRQYAEFFHALTHSHNIRPHTIMLYREGKKVAHASDWLWETSVLKYQGKIDQLPYNNAINTPEEDLVREFLQIHHTLPDTMDHAIQGNTLERISYSNSYAAQSNVSLNLEYKFEETCHFTGLLHNSFTLRVSRIETKETQEKKSRLFQNIAQVGYKEEEGKYMFIIDKTRIHRESMGAIHGFLQEMDASYQLSAPIPRDVYDIFDQCARILKE